MQRHGTITVVKIIPLTSVSVTIMVYFVIQMRDKKNKKTAHFFVYSRRATHDSYTAVVTVIEEVRV